MKEKVLPNLQGVSETLLVTLYTRALESQRPNARIRDPQAVALVNQIDYDFEKIRLHGHDQIALILRVSKFDEFTRAFLRPNPDAVVVHLGCGLDTRFDRVDNGSVEWFDLDFPPVIELRRELMRHESSRYHTIASSIFEEQWIEEVSQLLPRSFLFLAEGVFPYCTESQIKALLLKLRVHFPGAEMVFDAQTPFAIQMNNFQLAFSQINARMQWGLKDGKDLEAWHAGIKLLDEWYFFDDPEPRMNGFRWMQHVSFLGKSTGIFHYRLG